MTEEHARHGGLAIHGPAGDDPGELLRRRQVARRMKIAAVVVLVLLGAGAARTVLSRSANARTLEAAVAEHAALYVKTTAPKAGGAGQVLQLPGTLQGAVQAPIAARAAGYVKRWTKDIGSRVAQGEVLAEIEA